MFGPKMRAVVKREYVQHVRSKAFWIATILIPFLGLLFVFIQVFLNQEIVSKGKVAVVDLSGRLYATLSAEHSARGDSDEEQQPASKQVTESPLEKSKRMPTRINFVLEAATPQTLPAVRKKLNEEVQSGALKAYIVLDQKTLETGAAEWRAQSVKTDLVMRERIEKLLSLAATKERLKDRGVQPDIYEKARITVSLDPHEAKEIETAEGAKNIGFNLAVSGIFSLLIYISMFVYGAFIMRGVMEEKNNRIVEVIISSVRPQELMFGKILGIGLVGLTQYMVWGVIALAISLPGIVTLLGVTEGVPQIPVETIVAFVGFFLLGYFLYASMYAALAAPFNTEQEAQQFVMIPTMMLAMSSMTWFLVFNNPNGGLAIGLSMFPFTAPLVMFMRISVQPPPLWQIGLSVAILFGSICLMAWFAGRVYRVGILMYGKKPTLPEIFRWAWVD